MTESVRSGGLLDLEKELTCSICTEVLYQPLTLLDCLHTFCGSCLKLWFSWQATQASSRDSTPFTCPSCRAIVRGTRPDAKINTLLDMYLQANPDKVKSEEEREEIKQKYTPGEDVIAKAEVATEDESLDEEDRRMVEEVREMSLRDIGRRENRTYERGVRHRNRSRDTRTNQGRSDGHRAREESRTQARQIEHQSSLRSLISTSDVDSAEMEEEILRQIMEEGLLDGIDLQNMSVSQEDELSERIAEAYRRRHLQGHRAPESRNRDARRTESSRNESAATRHTNRQGTSRQHTMSASTSETATPTSHPPVSRPHLLEAYPAGQGHRRRTSSEGRRQTNPLPASSPVRHEAARSATDLSQHPRYSSESRERRISDISTNNPRRSTDPRPRRLSEGGRRVDVGTSRTRTTTGSSRSSPSRAAFVDTSPSQLSPVIRTESPIARDQRVPPTSHPEGTRSVVSAVRNAESPRPSLSSSPRVRSQPVLFPEPSITCDGCGKEHIEYDLHENCSICKGGNYNLCHRCYRSDKGCHHWFGFGSLAWHRFQRRGNQDQELPHTLIGRKYQRPKPEIIQQGVEQNDGTFTTEDPVNRLQSGAFCSNCSSYANECFWKCDYCNYGEWGYCEKCVNHGKCCTHPLLPLAHVSAAKPRNSANSSNRHSEAFFAPITSPSMVQAFPPANSVTSAQYRPLAFSTNCDVCRYPIQANQSRHHCYECNDGNYDICIDCYAKLVDSGRISREHGDRGWRRCLRGHRMVVVYFEDTALGQQRVIVKDLVGGHFLKDEFGLGNWRWKDDAGGRSKYISRQYFNEENSSMTELPAPQVFPPDGGVGLQVVAAHAFLGTDGAIDELSFPWGAEIREVTEISEEWFMGCYAGLKGVFPSNHVKVIRAITM